jgi:hypothetical protein
MIAQPEQNIAQPEQNIAQPDAPLPPRIAMVADLLAEVIARRIREAEARDPKAKAEQS